MYLVYLKLISNSQAHSWLQGSAVKFHIPLQGFCLFVVCWETIQKKNGQGYSGAIIVAIQDGWIPVKLNPYKSMIEIFYTEGTASRKALEWELTRGI
jgi:hypothetical protein